MTTNAEITLYHYNADTEAYTVKQYEASLHKTVRAVPDESGFRYDDVYQIRIPTTDPIPINTGDYIRFGIVTDARPDKASCVKIAGFSDDRRGMNPHWRIEAI